ncbi:MAG: carboxypeptidase-like regulatory domain-containing protein [Bacteroides sp.]|nr:carboxypeptidase-like regulatory domain-containing protein [Bacteroides sp.]MCM1095135.1 carboxypeptidase-like regulatory domain-containing protein [Terasakiella sp.]
MSSLRLISSAIACAAAIAATAAVKITGLVTDENNEPLEFASVHIGGTAIGATTGLDGRYTISAPDADTIRVIISCIGYEDARRKLVGATGTATVNAKMQPKSYALQGVEVTDFQKQTSTVQKIDLDDYRRAPDASGGSVESLISTMAGVASGNEMSSQYNVRGGSYDENLVYINGTEVYRPQLVTSGQQEGLSVINPDMVGAIGFSAGGFSARYGDKMSSVLDITYREPEAFEGAVSASLMGGSVAIGSSSRRFTQLHGLRYKSNASLLSSTEEKGEYDPRFFDYQTSLTFRFSDKLKASLLGNIAINDYKFVPASRTTNFGTSTDAKQFKVYFDGQEKDRFETWFGALNLTYSPSKKTSYTLHAAGFLTNELVSYDISGEYWLDQAGTSGSPEGGGAIGGELGVGRYMEHARNRLKARVFTVGLHGAAGLRGGHNLEYGLSLNAESIRDRSREWELRDSAGFSLPATPDALRLIYNLDSRHDISSTRLAFYAMDTWRLTTGAGYLNINGGLRMSYWSFNKEFLASPRVSATFIPDAAPRWTIRLATGLYYQQPFFKEYRQPVSDSEGNTVIRLNDKIKSQRSFQLIAGTDFTFRGWGRPFKLTAEAYYKALGNLIPYEVDNLKLTYSGENLTSGFATGIDFKLFGQFVPGSDSWISFSLMKSQETLNGVKVPRPSDRRYALALFFTDYFPKFPRLKFSLRGILNDGLPTTAPRRTRDKGYFRAPAYKRVDIGLSYGLLTPDDRTKHPTGLLSHFKSIWLGLDVFNLLDISNVSGYYWVTDVNNIQYAVPNYLTRRQINVRLSIDF